MTYPINIAKRFCCLLFNTSLLDSLDGYLYLYFKTHINESTFLFFLTRSHGSIHVLRKSKSKVAVFDKWPRIKFTYTNLATLFKKLKFIHIFQNTKLVFRCHKVVPVTSLCGECSDHTKEPDIVSLSFGNVHVVYFFFLFSYQAVLLNKVVYLRKAVTRCYTQLLIFFRGDEFMTSFPRMII